MTLKNGIDNKNPTGVVELPTRISVGDFSKLIGIPPEMVIKELMRSNYILNINSQIELDIAAVIAGRLGVSVRKPKAKEDSNAKHTIPEDKTLTAENAKPRAPVVTILGHVDHGKTTLLDTIRKTSKTDDEPGGITQRIGAYQVKHNGKDITFIDTPGHEAFTKMREKGAQVTDIAVLVVAADDGVQPQTSEAIDHARAANVPIVVAINKIDLPGAEPTKIKSELYEVGIVTEDLGGNVVSCLISAKNKEGIEELLEAILLVAEISELKANPSRPGLGSVIESYIDKARGSTSSVIVRTGTVEVGNYVVAGFQRGRVKKLVDGFGKSVKKAGPSTPIEVLGLDGMAQPGDQFEVVESDRAARKLAKARRSLSSKNPTFRAATMSEALRLVGASKALVLNVVLKTASQGSVDAVTRSVELLSGEETVVKILRAGAGPVNEADIMLASASEGIVLAFDTPVEPGAAKQLTMRNVSLMSFDVIYELTDALKEYIERQKEPETSRTLAGRCRVLDIFPHRRSRKIAGVKVSDGSIERNALVTVVRDKKVIFEGRISSMRHFQENVRKLENNFEGGIMLSGFDAFEKEDLIESWNVTTG